MDRGRLETDALGASIRLRLGVVTNQTNYQTKDNTETGFEAISSLHTASRLYHPVLTVELYPITRAQIQVIFQKVRTGPSQSDALPATPSSSEKALNQCFTERNRRTPSRYSQAQYHFNLNYI